MDRFDPKSLLTFDDLPEVVSREQLMTQSSASEPALVHETPSLRPQNSVYPIFEDLKSLLLNDLKSNLPLLLTLNRTRREAITRHLDRLTGTVTGESLETWIQGPRNPKQEAALETYLEEIAVFVLGQALLLKAWSDRGQRNFSPSDLSDLNWTLCQALKERVPIDRDGWQITRPNLYSWYRLDASLHEKVWDALGSWRLLDEGPTYLTSVLGAIRKVRCEHAPERGYDSRLFGAIWQSLRSFGVDAAPETGPFKRRKSVFSPTLRDGSMILEGPVNLSWVGLESAPFLLMTAELAQLWWGPAEPPLWAVGSGLEVHTREQLHLALGSPKRDLLTRITEMEACEVGFVLEEQAIRAQGRGYEAQAFREHVEGLPYFKKLRATRTTLGDLQAAVTLSKLRPGGLLWWAREEPLTAQDGQELLGFMLDRAKLVCEWDFSGVEHHLPGTRPLFPKYLYLLKRDPSVETRITNRPLRATFHGQIRSHVEVAIFLQDAFTSVIRGEVQTRGPWDILLQPSPTEQREWAERWPDPCSQNTLRSLEKLKASSLCLASFSTIRPTPQGASWKLDPSLKGFWVSSAHDGERRSLAVHALPGEGELAGAEGTGFLILVPDESWSAPLRAYFSSETVRAWLEQFAERKGERWILSEQVMRWIPVPKPLLRMLGVQAAGHSGPSEFALPLPGEWERVASEVGFRPDLVRQELKRLPADSDPLALEVHATVFVRAARAIEQMERTQRRLFSMVAPDGKLKWKEILAVLPPTELVAVPFHPRINLAGHLPHHLPINRISRLKAPNHGITLASESGFHLQVNSDRALIIDLLWEQLQGIEHPTWGELVDYLRLPKRPEVAESAGNDILRSHGEQTAKLRSLRELQASCALY